MKPDIKGDDGLVDDSFIHDDESEDEEPIIGNKDESP